MRKNHLFVGSICLLILLLSACSKYENNHLINPIDEEVIISPYISPEAEILEDAKNFREGIVPSGLRALSEPIDYSKTEVSSYYEKIPVTSDMQVKKSVRYQQIPVYILNYKTQSNQPAGFVIKASDSRIENLTLAFSDEGQFSGFDKLEEADGGYFKERIGAYIFSTIEQIPISEEMEKRVNAVYTLTYKAPLLKVTWDQTISPYNNYSPVCSGQTKMPAGCSAIALAQIMTYYKWPEKGYYTRKTTGQAIPVTYNYWNEITQTANATNLTNSQHREHVANLCAEAGYWLRTDYKCDASSAGNYNVIGTLRKMGYKDMILRAAMDRNYDFVYIWDDIMAGRPVFMATTARIFNNGMKSKSHAYVVDGIQTVQANNKYGRDFYIHVNFGWEGQDNGYYLVYPGVDEEVPTFMDEEVYYIWEPVIVTNIQKDSQNNGATK